MKVHPTTSTAGFVRPRVRSWLGAATALARLALAAALGGLVVMTASLISPHDATGAVPDCATAPNARTWISGPPPASWNNNLRWSNNGSQPPLPGPDEIACIGDEPVELNVPAEVDAVVSGPNGTLAMPTGQVLTLSPQNGEVSQVANIGERPALAGTGDMIVTKSFIADGPGYKIAGPAGSTLTLAPSVGTNARIGLAHLDGRSLVVSDGVTMTSSSTFGFLGLFSIESSNGGSIVNSGVWNAPADGSILRASSASVFRNTATGILKKTGGSSVTAVLAERIVNDGLIDNQTSGVLGLGGKETRACQERCTSRPPARARSSPAAGGSRPASSSPAQSSPRALRRARSR